MTAFSAGTVSAEMIAADHTRARHVLVQNFSGTAMHIAIGTDAGTSAHVRIGSAGSLEFDLPQGKNVYAITAGSAQAAPLDTRYEVF